MPDANAFLALTDADLKAALFRAIRTIGILALVAAPVILFFSGWQSAVLFLVGAAISAAGVYESQRLVALVNAKLDDQRPPRSTAATLAMFFLRLTIAGAVLYVSLRCLNGSAYAMIAGLALAIVALSVEVVKLAGS
jgi:Na+/H+-translocating membrane pyrophosphatase